MGEKLTVQTEKTRLVRYLLYLYCVSDRFRNDSVLFTWNGFKFLKHVESKTNQYEIVVVSMY